MITIEHENYIRFILLLLEAGTDLLREILEKALQKKGETLDQFLKSAEPALRNDRCLTQIQKNTLYPQNPQISSIKDFDITLLSHLLFKYLKAYIDNNEKQGVKDIRDLRNNHHAHAAEGKMDIVTYTREWNQLATIIRYTGNGLSPDVQKRHRNMIANIEKDPLDITVVAEQIKKLDQSIVFFQNIQTCLDVINTVQEELVGAVESVKTITENTDSTVEHIKIIVQKSEVEMAGTHKDVLDTKEEVMQMKAMLVQIKEQRENQGRPTKVVNTVYGKLSISADDQDTVDKAEAVLLETSKNSIAKKEPSDINHKILQEKVTLAIEDIENKDVKVEDAKKGSIILEFKCLTLAAILELIDYYYSPSFKRRIDEVAKALEDIIGKKICVKVVGIDRLSLQEVIIKMDKKDYEKVVQFELSCRGVDGLVHALEVFEEGKTVNSINELSNALSDAIGKPVTLHTSIDMNQMRKAINFIPDEHAYESQDSHSKRIDPPINPLITSQDIQSGLKQPSSKQDISDLESEDERMKLRWSSLLNLQKARLRRSRRCSTLKADEEAEPSRSCECNLRPASKQGNPKAESDYVFHHSMMGFRHPIYHSSSIQPSPYNPYLLPSSSFWPGSVKQDTSKAEYGKPSCTQGYESQDSCTKGNDPLINPITTFQNMELTQSGAKQDISEFESEEEVIKHSRPSTYRQPSCQYPSFEADEETKTSLTYKRLRSSEHGAPKSEYEKPSYTQAYISRGLHTKGNGPKIIPITFRNIEAGLTQSSARQNISDIEYEDKLVKHLKSSTYEQPMKRKLLFKADEVSGPSRSCKCLPCIEQDAPKAKYKIPNYTQDRSTEVYEHSCKKLALQPPMLSLHNQVLVYLKEINVDHQTQPHTRILHSCALLSPNKLLKAYYFDKYLEIVDTNTGSVLQQKILNGFPCGITALPYNQAAVTFPNADEILILSADNLSTIRSIPVESCPSGITYHQDELLYVICAQDKLKIVRVLNLQGGSLRKFELDSADFFDIFIKVAVSKDQHSLYITDYNTKSLIRYSLIGLITAKRVFNELLWVRWNTGLALLDDGSLLFLCGNPGSIYHVSADLKHGYELKRIANEANCLSYDHENNQVYIGCNNAIHVYNLRKPGQKQAENEFRRPDTKEDLACFKTEKTSFQT